MSNQAPVARNIYEDDESAPNAIGIKVEAEALIINSRARGDASDLTLAANATVHLDDLDYRTSSLGSGAVVEPLAGDRSVYDALAYQARHTNDVDDAAGIHHTQAALNQIYLKRQDLLNPPARLDMMQAALSALPDVNSNVGTFGDATHVAQVTLDAKGRVTRAYSIPIIPLSTSNAIVAPGRYRQFVYAVSSGDFAFVKTSDGQPVTVLLDLE